MEFERQSTGGGLQISHECSGSDENTKTRVCCKGSPLPGGCACFDTSCEPFSKIPMVQLPECSLSLRTRFILKNKAFPDGIELPDCNFDGEIKESFKTNTGGETIKEQGKVFFIVHGWKDDYNYTWVRNLQIALQLKQPLSHVVLVDWSPVSKLKQPQQYPVALASIRPIGLIMAGLLCRMKEALGVRMEDVHIIGHSLGAHLAGMAGTELRRVCGATVGRITGLDPGSGLLWDAPDGAILDKTDAAFVDIIHTNGKAFTLQQMMAALSSGKPDIVPRGLPRSTGHVDFWPNGGEQQPGCDSQTCSHHRVHWVFLSTVLDFCEFPATDAKDDHSCSCVMGFNVNPSCRGDYRNITTTDQFPFCKLK